MHKYFVSEANQITPSTLLLTLHRDNNSTRIFSFQPGQYAAISFKRHRRPTPARCFSIVSSPTEQDILQFSMRTRGHFTKALTELKKGDEVKIRGPYGGFVFDQERDNEAVLIAGGIGITPFLSMIRYVTSTGLANKISLLYSIQSQDDVPFKEELLALEKKNPNFTVLFVIGDGPKTKFEKHHVASGRITPEIIDKIAKSKYQDKTFFICGPPPFMKTMVKVLKDNKTPRSRLITEAFSQGPNRQTGKVYSWPVNMYVFSAAGIVLGSFIVMISDLLKTMPPSSIFGSSSINRKTTLTNSRQTDVDKLVNELPEKDNTAPATHAVNKAIAAYEESLNIKPAANPGTSNKDTTVTKSKPAPKCTTTQSGVTTCI